MNPIPETEWFAAPWRTPCQTRDLLIEFLHGENLTTENVDNLRLTAKKETLRRKSLPDLYVKCIPCSDYHGQLNNIDNLCEKCEAATAPVRFDFYSRKMPS